VGSVSASGGFPFTPGVPSVINTLPSGLNFMTTLPFGSSPGNVSENKRDGTGRLLDHG
jgi:hypothetical protein